jgi:hypothetical protein
MCEKIIALVYGIEGMIVEQNFEKYRENGERPLPAANTYILSISGVEGK